MARGRTEGAEVCDPGHGRRRNGRRSIRERRLVTRRSISSLASVRNTCDSTFSLPPPHHGFGSSSCSTERGQTYPAVMEIRNPNREAISLNKAPLAPIFIYPRDETTGKTWCGRRDLNPHGPFKPCGFSYRLRLSPPRRDAFGELTPGLRSGLSLHPPPETPELRCCPSSLYTFPAGVSPGLARDCHLRFPRI